MLSFILAACAAQEPSPAPIGGPGPGKATDIAEVQPTSIPTSTPQTPATRATINDPVQSIPDPENVRWTILTGGLRSPLGLENAGDERLFILERLGMIWIFKDGGVLDKPFLNLSSSITTQGSEQGLLGLAFHPDYSSNGYFFVNYTDKRGDTVVSRFQVSSNPNVADPGSEKLILQIQQPYRNHNGGDLAFGPEGYLYIPTGDGGSGGDPDGNAQNLDTLLGKILRIDVDSADPYASPADNMRGGKPEIWAFGLRNPWRVHFDDVTRDLYIADVGQNQWEEINFQPAGAQAGWNFGWDLREGRHPYEGEGGEGLVDPVAEYSHQLGISITGGVVVHDQRLPDWQGIYLYGDFGSGIIWGLLKLENGGWANVQLWETDTRISSFGQDHEGRVYLVDYSGRIMRLDQAQ